MKKILITGVAGFIGSNLAQRLLEEGHQVFGVDNFITGSHGNISDLTKQPNFCFEEADTTSLTRNQIRKLSKKGFDEIYYLACPTGVPNLTRLAEEMLLTCSVGTKNILDVALKSKARFLFTSSSEVYGDPQEFPQNEDYTGNVDPTGLRSPYEEGKRYAESLIMTYVRKYGFEGKIVRVFNTYGPNMNKSDERIIPKFIGQIKNGQPLTVHGDGTQKRTYCHVYDLIDGLTLVMNEGETGEVYNLGSREEISVMDLAKLMIDLSNTNVGISTAQRPPHDHQARMPDTSKVSRLGWSPKTSLEEGLRKTFASIVKEKEKLNV